jgi:aldose 1-epimerase
MRFKIKIDASPKYPVINLQDSVTGCEAEIYSFGALLNKFTINVNGQTVNAVDGFSSVDDVIENITNGFKSAKLAPFPCRMNVGEYVFLEKKYKIEKHYIPPHAIHGIIYDNAFEILATHADEHHASAGLKLNYKGTDKGYPFSFELLVNWKLEVDNKLTVKSTVFHHNPHAIPYADGWHPYFTVGSSIDESNLQFGSDTMLEFDDTLLPTGNNIHDARFVDGTSMNGIFLDNCFELKGENPKCILSNDTLRLIIQPDAAYPYLQIYTPPHRNSIAIENLSGAPDCFNNGIGLTLLQPEKHYSFSTSYTLKTK